MKFRPIDLDTFLISVALFFYFYGGEGCTNFDLVGNVL